jgi:hypothetical protein
MVGASLMKYFKDSGNNVFAYEADGSQDAFILADLVPISEEEADALRFPAPDPAEVLAAERASMVVSRFQARAALFNAGLLAGVEAAVAAADPFTQIAWADAQEFRRMSMTIAALSAAVGLTDEQLDDLFRAAALIEA